MTTFELRILKRNNAFMVTIILLLLGGIGGGIAAFNNHEGRLSSVEVGQENILNSGAEFISRRVTAVEIEKSEKRINKKLDAKADKSAFDIMVDDLKYIRKKIDEK